MQNHHLDCICVSVTGSLFLLISQTFKWYSGHTALVNCDLYVCYWHQIITRKYQGALDLGLLSAQGIRFLRISNTYVVLDGILSGPYFSFATPELVTYTRSVLGLIRSTWIISGLVCIMT